MGSETRSRGAARKNLALSQALGNRALAPARPWLPRLLPQGAAWRRMVCLRWRSHASFRPPSRISPPNSPRSRQKIRARPSRLSSRRLAAYLARRLKPAASSAFIVLSAILFVRCHLNPGRIKSDSHLQVAAKRIRQLHLPRRSAFRLEELRAAHQNHGCHRSGCRHI